ncbi:MAG: hypothetical protein ACFFEU_14010 [Candidatus Thorarchaeota archaeon]
MSRLASCLLICLVIFLSAYPATGLQSLPSISEPDDITYVEGDAGNVIEWWVSFSSPLHYSIHRNDSVLRSESLGGSSGNITISIDGLSAAVYFYIVIVDDFSDNVSTDSVVVTVLQPTQPDTNDFDLLLGTGAAVFVIAIIVVIMFVILRPRQE